MKRNPDVIFGPKRGKKYPFEFTLLYFDKTGKHLKTVVSTHLCASINESIPPLPWMYDITAVIRTLITRNGILPGLTERFRGSVLIQYGELQHLLTWILEE